MAGLFLYGPFVGLSQDLWMHSERNKPKKMSDSNMKNRLIATAFAISAIAFFIAVMLSVLD
jgi:hypothetical protein